MEIWSSQSQAHIEDCDICLVTCAINSLSLANNTQVQVINVHRYSVEISPIGHDEQKTIKIPCISFKFRMPFGQPYQLTWKQFPLRLVCNDVQQMSITDIVKIFLDITSPPFIHGWLYVALSHVQDYRNIRFYVMDEQLTQSNKSSSGFMPIVNNIVYQNVLSLNGTNHDTEGNIAAIEESLEDLI